MCKLALLVALVVFGTIGAAIIFTPPDVHAHDPCAPLVFENGQCVEPPQVPTVCFVPQIQDNPNEAHPCSDGSTADAGPLGVNAPPYHGFTGNNREGVSWAVSAGTGNRQYWQNSYVIDTSNQRYCTSPGYTHTGHLHMTADAVELVGNFSNVSGDVPFLLNGSCVQ